MIVSDSSPLIFLAKAGRLTLLRDLYHKVLIPNGVKKEVLIEGKPGSAKIKEALKENWLEEKIIDPNFDYKSESISKTDAEVISLAESQKTSLLTNDKALYYLAKSHGVQPKWFTKGVLIYAIKNGQLSPEEGEKLLTDLVQVGLRIKSEVFAKLMKEIHSYQNQ